MRSIVGSAEAVRVRLDAYPIGTVDAAVLPNPLVAPEPGALLARWPKDPMFVLRYEGTGGTSYAVDVYRGDGTTLVSGCSDL